MNSAIFKCSFFSNAIDRQMSELATIDKNQKLLDENELELSRVKRELVEDKRSVASKIEFFLETYYKLTTLS